MMLLFVGGQLGVVLFNTCANRERDGDTPCLLSFCTEALVLRRWVVSMRLCPLLSVMFS